MVCRTLALMTRRNAFILVFWLGVAVLGRSQTSSSSTVPSGPANVRTAGQAFKNIHVLKDVPSDQLIPAMQFITASLGVECGFCHVENHFEQDDKKPKLIARKMMEMMMAINQNNFDGHRMVTCNTCHRGARNPVGIPAISEQAMPPRGPANEESHGAENLPSANDLLKKYVASLGGETAIAKISNREEKGTANFAGREIPVDIYDKAPAKRAMLIHLPNGDSTTAFDGEQGWTGTPGRSTRALPSSDLEGAKIDADLQLPLHLAELFSDLHPGQPENIDGHATFQLISENSGQPRIRLYFDQQTGLLVRMVRYADSPLGLNPTQIDYDDYRQVDSVQVPFRSTIARPSGLFTVQLSDVKQNVVIDDARFQRPPAPAQTGQTP